jgi:hypothetical protein
VLIGWTARLPDIIARVAPSSYNKILARLS